MNSYESEVMRGHAEKAGLEGAIIVNTCAVTAEAMRTARQTIRRAAKDNPNAPVIVTGCAAQIDADMFADMPEVTRVIGNHEKMQAETWQPVDLLGGTEKVRVNDIMSVKETAAHLIDGMEGRARAYVQVQNGCDHRCTFCIIPFGRGNSRSVPAGVVVVSTPTRKRWIFYIVFDCHLTHLLQQVDTNAVQSRAFFLRRFRTFSFL